MTREEMVAEARRVLQHESDVLRALAIATELETSFAPAVLRLKQCKADGGMAVLTGVGKSALVAQRIAATLTVAGMPARYLSPLDAAHGDIGSMREPDVLIVVSRSGETEEIVRMVDVRHDYYIAITAAPNSTLALNAACTLLHSASEAGPYALIPTSTSTAAAALGDALAIVLQQELERTPADFAALHYGGTLGRRMRLTVKDVMVTGDAVGRVTEGESLLHTLIVLAQKRGTLVVLGSSNPDIYLGVVTAGDITRYITQASAMGEEWEHLPVRIAVTTHPRTTTPGVLVADVITQMQEARVMALPVLDCGEPVGMIHLHDALRARVQ